MQGTAKKHSKKEAQDKKQQFDLLRKSWYTNLLFVFVLPFVVLVGTEWVARGSLTAGSTGSGFMQALVKHFPSFFIAYLLLLAIYVLLLAVTGRHLPGAILIEVLGFVPATVTYYKLNLRGEPFLPWDFTQIDELLQLGDSVTLTLSAHLVVVFLLFALFAVAAAYVKIPHRRDWISRGFMGAGALGCALLLLFGIFLNPAGSQGVGIQEDSWMQDRYYRNHGVITGFLTNLQMLDIEKPAGYNEASVQAIVQQMYQNAESREPLYDTSYAVLGDGTVSQPDIIFLMAESFWDVTALEGVVYDREILPNLTRLQQEAAYGYAYTPSFGGGTCDVEFEALTGFSMEHLPSGSKPYQQYVTQPMASLPGHLKEQGYTTVAIHGYGGKFWSRDSAYPNLGLDTFIDSSQFENPRYRRGFISDESMVDRIMEEQRAAGGSPVFIHAVTMQNHTTYDPSRYPEGELVRVLSAPEGVSESVVGQLEDCATGMYEMDAALGKLVEYLRGYERPTIVVFWGDHLNPMSDGYTLFEATGFIEEGATNSPQLHMTPLLIWSNYYSESINLGTVATYNLSPVLMDLYGLEMPAYFEFLTQQISVMPVKTRGVVVNPDGSFSQEMTEEQAQAFADKAVLQYDMMFASEYMQRYLQ